MKKFVIENKKYIIFISMVIILLAFISLFLFVDKDNGKKCLVEFNTDGGTKISSVKIEKGNLLTIPKEPEKEGYIFIGWTKDGKIFDFNIPITENIILKAKWERIKEGIENYIVKFDTNGGTTILNQVIKKGSKIIKPQDPEKEGYKFIGWELDSVDYNFDTEITKDIILKAKWEEVKDNKSKEENSNSNSVNNSNKPNNSESSDSNNNSTSIQLSIPKLTKLGVGGNPEEWGADYEITELDVADGVEIYRSTEQNNGYKLERKLTKIELSSQSNRMSILAKIGEQFYYKVRAYKKVNGKEVYSNYTNVISIVGPQLSIPKLTKLGTGGNPEEWGADYEITELDVADGVEIYRSTEQNNGYKLERKLTKIELSSQSNRMSILAKIGEQFYYKVRAYKKVNGKEVYSNYTNVISIVGPQLSIPKLTKLGTGGNPEEWGADYEITELDVADGVEIYRSTEQNNGYKLERKLTKIELSSQSNRMSILAKIGEQFYYKVRAYKKVNGKEVYSNYTNVISISGPAE